MSFYIALYRKDPKVIDPFSSGISDTYKSLEKLNKSNDFRESDQVAIFRGESKEEVEVAIVEFFQTRPRKNRS